MREEFINWKAIADDYRAHLKRLLRDFDQMNRDIEVLHGDNPVAQYATNRLRLLIEEITQRLDDGNRPLGE